MTTRIRRNVMAACSVALLALLFALAGGGPTAEARPARRAAEPSAPGEPATPRRPLSPEARAYLKRLPVIEDKGLLPFWTVKRANAQPSDPQAHLLGTVHMGKSEWFPMAAPIEAAIDGAEVVAIEFDAEAAKAEMTQLFTTRALWTGGESTATLLGQSRWAALESAFDQPLAQFSIFKPWALGIVLVAIDSERHGLHGELGVEPYLMGRVRGRARIVELESAASQFDMLDSLPMVAQLSMIDATGFDPRVSGPTYAALMEAWRVGDVAALDAITRLGFDSEGGADLYDAMFTKRNLKMADVIVPLLDGPGDVIVAVGAGHYAGAGSVVAILQQRGFVVEQVARPTP